MPDYGRRGREGLPFTTPLVAPLYPAPPWPLPGARILQVSFEIDKDVALDWLPPSLTRPIPPYAHIIIAHYPSSPVGPFAQATQAIVCRWRLLARAFSLQTVVDNIQALAAFREFWGFPARPGRVSLAMAGEEVMGTVESVDGLTLATARLAAAEPAEASTIRYDPYLNLRLVRSARPDQPPPVLELAQVDPPYTIKEAWRGAGSVEYPQATPGHPWHLAQPCHIIAATYTVCDTELAYARYVVEF